MDFNTQDKIDAYIRGEMNASERAAFIKELTISPELRKEYEFTKKIATTISDRERKKLQIREWNKKNNKTIYVYSAITSIAAIFIVGFLVFHNIPNDAPIPPLVSTDGYSSTMSSENYYEFTEISLLIAEKNYQAALKHIEKAEKSYCTIANDSIISDNKDVAYDCVFELKWYKAQALIGLNMENEAQIILKEIMNSDSRFKKKADSLWYELGFDESTRECP